MSGTNTTVKSYRGYEIIDVTPQEGITAAEYDLTCSGHIKPYYMLETHKAFITS